MAIKTDAQVKAVKLMDGQTRRTDAVADGLYLFTNKSGKYWRWSYRYNGKHKEFSIGTYPAISLKDAKTALAAPKALLKVGIDPNQDKKDRRQAKRQADQQKKAQVIEDSNTLEAVGREWFATIESGWADSHAIKQANRLKNHLYPAIGHIPVKQLTRQQITDALKQIQSPDIAKRVGQMCRAMLDYALNTGLIEAVPLGSLKNVLPAVVSTHMPVITDNQQLGAFLRACDAFQGTYTVLMALKLLPYLAVRGGEFRQAEWCEFNFDDAVWTIPASHRKLKLAKKRDPANTHIVPLPKQSIELLWQLQQVTGRGKHVFPSARGDARSMSDAAINTAYAAVGFKGQMVAHSWRSVFSTAMNAAGFNPDAIERQLAHGERNAVRAAYNRNDYLDERATMLQQHADWLDGLRTGASVINIGRASHVG